MWACCERSSEKSGMLTMPNENLRPTKTMILNAPRVLTESQFDKLLSERRFFRRHSRTEAAEEFATRLRYLIRDFNQKCEGAFDGLVYVDHDLAPAERISCDVDSKVDVRRLLNLCSEFLRDFAPEFCILVTFHGNMYDGETYIGRLAWRLDTSYCEEAVFEGVLKKFGMHRSGQD